MSKFDLYLAEQEEYNTILWSNPLYHGTSLKIANSIIDSKTIAPLSLEKDSGVNEMGRGFYLHPSMNRTSPWVLLASKKGFGAFIKLQFKYELKLAIFKNKQMSSDISIRQLMDNSYDGIYDKNGITQVPHQILLFNTKLNRLDNKIDWDNSSIIKFDPNTHGYLSGYDNAEEKKYYH